MSGIAPDSALIEVIFKGENRPCEVRLTLQDQQRATGSLDTTAAGALSLRINQGWHTGLHEQLGRELFQLLLPEPLATLYASALRASGRRGLRLALEIDPELPALHHVPWERMLHPVGAGWLPLAAAPNVFFSRRLRPGQPWPLPAPAGALKALVVVSSPFPQGSPFYVDSAKEQAAILEVLAQFPDQVQAEVLSGEIRLQQIVDRLNSAGGYDILYYAGHGTWNDATQTGALILTGPQPDGSSGPVEVSAAEVVDKLGSVGSLPRLVFLGACESGQQSTFDAFAGVGPALVIGGCPAVVCMQEKVENAVARPFAVEFTSNLLLSGCVDLAMNRARVTLLENQYFQWAVPVLYMHLLDGLLFNPVQRFRPAQPQPYKKLAPYGRDDGNLFKGRTVDVTEVATRIRAGQITLVHGESGVGLTSLLDAGVCKVLTEGNEQVRCRVVRVEDYGDLAGEIRTNLVEDGRPVFLPLAGDAALADVLQAVANGPFAALVLMLDQFENALALPPARQQEIFDGLDAGLAAAGQRLKLVIALNSDFLSGQAQLQSWLGSRAGNWVEVLPLQPDNAVEAIYQPLRDIGSAVQINRKYVKEQIVPDLTGLYAGKASKQKSWVDPGQLQIVSSWLYEKAENTNEDTIELYEDTGGADGILARYMSEEMEQLFPGESADIARKIFVALAAPQMDHWVRPEQVTIRAAAQDGQPGAPVPAGVVTTVLNQLVRAELLTRRFQDGGYAYAFSNHTVAEQAVLLGGESVRLAYQVGDELERAWRLWLAEREESQADPARLDAALPGVQQLRRLAEFGAHIDAPPVKLLLLLRAAVLHREPVDTWLEKLRKKENELHLVQALESSGPQEPEPAISGVARSLSHTLLGMGAASMPKRPDNAYGYGEVAWAAVNSGDPISRQTAALALAVLPGGAGEALARLHLALDAGAKRPRLAGQVYGSLAEHLPEADRGAVEREIRHLPLSGRLAAYLWRGTWRAINDRGWIAWSTLGGALGAGLGLGLERLLVGILATPPGQTIRLLGSTFFFIHSYTGFLLMLLCCLGLALAGPIFLRNRSHTTLAQRLLLGTLGFGFANLAVSFITGGNILAVPFPILAGFLAGILLSAPLALQDAQADAHLSGRVLAAGAVAALLFAGLHAVFLAFPNLGVGITSALSAGAMNSLFQHWGWLQRAYPSDWADLISLADALLSGSALAFGGLAGRRLAAIGYARWQVIVNRGSD